jgi:hypothetical protein
VFSIGTYFFTIDQLLEWILNGSYFSNPISQSWRLPRMSTKCEFGGRVTFADFDISKFMKNKKILLEEYFCHIFL